MEKCDADEKTYLVGLGIQPCFGGYRVAFVIIFSARLFDLSYKTPVQFLR